MQDIERPRLHFTPQKGWINDPNGLVYDGERYHLFAQHNPDDVRWGPMHWLHATSTDLLRWEDRGIALYPDALGTMFSGSAVMTERGRMALMYTAHGESQQQCVAFSSDGETFEKYAGNPVIPNPGIADFRDPKLFWNKRYACWSVALAASDRIDFYRSDDLIHWTKTGEFGAKENRFGELFECPDCFALTAPDGREVWVLTASMIFRGAEKGCRMQYFLGAFDGDAFVETMPSPEPLRLDAGYDCYAGVTYSGTRERTFIAWMTATSNPLPMPVYCGCLTLARTLRLVETDDGLRLAQRCVLPPHEMRAVPEDGTLPQGAFVLNARARGAFELSLSGAKSDESLGVGVDAQNCVFTKRDVSPLFAPGAAYNDDARRRTAVPRMRRGEVNLQIVCDSYCVEIFADDGLYAHGLLSFVPGGLRRLAATGDVSVEVARL